MCGSGTFGSAAVLGSSWHCDAACAAAKCKAIPGCKYFTIEHPGSYKIAELHGEGHCWKWQYTHMHGYKMC